MKTIIICCLIAVAGPLWSQHSFKKELYKGDSLWVYPYRLEIDQNNIPPVGDPLPDGQYIVYYKSKGKRLAAIFSAKGGLKNGEAIFYHYKKEKIRQKGHYLNDLKEGQWVSYNTVKYKKHKYRRRRRFLGLFRRRSYPYTPSFLVSSNNGTSTKRRYYQAFNEEYYFGKALLFSSGTGVKRFSTRGAGHFSFPNSVSIEYKNGLAEGAYEFKNLKNGMVLTKGSYINNLPTGKWEHYYTSGGLRKTYSVPSKLDRFDSMTDYVSYHENGHKMEEALYNDTLTIALKEYRENGQLEHYKSYGGLMTKHGPEYWLNEQGDTVHTINWYKGNKVAEYTFHNGQKAYQMYHKWLNDSVIVQHIIDTSYINLSKLSEEKKTVRKQFYNYPESGIKMKYKKSTSKDSLLLFSYGYLTKHEYIFDKDDGWPSDTLVKSYHWEPFSHYEVNYYKNTLLKKREVGSTKYVEENAIYRLEASPSGTVEFTIKHEDVKLQFKGKDKVQSLVGKRAGIHPSDTKEGFKILIKGEAFTGTLEKNPKKRKDGYVLIDASGNQTELSESFSNYYFRSQLRELYKIDLREYLRNPIRDNMLLGNYENGLRTGLRKDSISRHYGLTKAMSLENSLDSSLYAQTSRRDRKKLHRKQINEVVFDQGEIIENRDWEQYVVKKWGKDKVLTKYLLKQDIRKENNAYHFTQYYSDSDWWRKGFWNEDKGELIENYSYQPDSFIVDNGLLNGKFNSRGSSLDNHLEWSHNEDAYITLRNSQLHGSFTKHYPYKEKAVYEDNYLVGKHTWSYRLSNQIRREITHKAKDKAQHNSREGERVGFETEFYKTGVKAREGENIKGLRTLEYRKTNYIDRTLAYKRNGQWWFYNEVGDTVKSIVYQNTNDGSIGTIKEWYDNGQQKSHGKVIEELFDNSCDEEQDPIIQIVKYDDFWLSDGQQIVSNGNGYVVNYHRTGHISETGEIEDGLRQGVWKFNDPDGKLFETGSYVNGRKDGRWLKGDLYGLKFLEGACYASEEDFKKAMEKNEGRVDIEVYLYENGKVQNSESYHFYPGDNDKKSKRKPRLYNGGTNF